MSSPPSARLICHRGKTNWSIYHLYTEDSSLLFCHRGKNFIRGFIFLPCRASKAVCPFLETFFFLPNMIFATVANRKSALILSLSLEIWFCHRGKPDFLSICHRGKFCFLSICHRGKKSIAASEELSNGWHRERTAKVPAICHRGK